jgi:glucosamine-6-phosphate deaminase
MKVIIQKDYDSMCRWAAEHIIKAINSHKEERPFVLGLPTGSSPLGVYKKLIEANKAGRVTFKNVVTFNMDEYVGLPHEHDQSYWYFMHDNFFDHIDIPAENINILNGMAEDPEAECAAYEEKIAAMGGIDLFMGGSGVDGHIAFNEPGTPFDSLTHIAELTESTIKDNSRLFNDISEVPTKAVTMGLKSIMNAKKIVLIATGKNKAKAIRDLLKGPKTEDVPCSILQDHPDCTIYVDEDAYSLVK